MESGTECCQKTNSTPKAACCQPVSPAAVEHPERRTASAIANHVNGTIAKRDKCDATNYPLFL
jgi:hypothetical protein